MAPKLKQASQHVNRQDSQKANQQASQQDSQKSGHQDSQQASQQSQESCCRHKNTPRSHVFQTDIERRINRAIGQLNGVKSMMEDNRYCGDVLTQLAAAESAIRRVSELILQEHMHTCVIEEIRAGNEEVVDEVITLMRRFR